MYEFLENKIVTGFRVDKNVDRGCMVRQISSNKEFVERFSALNGLKVKLRKTL